METNIREVLQGAVLAAGLRLVSICREQGFEVLNSTELIEIADAHWHLHLTVWNDHDQLIRVQAHPVGGMSNLPPGIAMLIRGPDAEVEERDEPITWMLPISWLETVQAAAASDALG